MAEKKWSGMYVSLAAGEPSRETARRAALRVADAASDAQECRQFLAMLGLVQGRGSLGVEVPGGQ